MIQEPLVTQELLVLKVTPALDLQVQRVPKAPKVTQALVLPELLDLKGIKEIQAPKVIQVQKLQVPLVPLETQVPPAHREIKAILVLQVPKVTPE